MPSASPAPIGGWNAGLHFQTKRAGQTVLQARWRLLPWVVGRVRGALRWGARGEDGEAKLWNGIFNAQDQKREAT